MKEGTSNSFCGTAFAYCNDENEKDKILENNNVGISLRIK